MAWMNRIESRQLRRLSHGLPSERQIAGIGHDAASFAGHAAHQLADTARHQGTALVREASHQGAALAREVGQHGGALAKEAGYQVRRATRAVRADPLPVIVGLVGLALLISLLFGRRR